jgi:crossover junction endodeoxyribonuclease RusA
MGIKADVFREDPKSKNKTLKLSLPVPPSVNSMYVNTRNGGRRLTSKAEHYTRDSRALLNLAVDEQHWKLPNRSVWLYVDCVFYFQDRRIRDSHNCLKLLLDVMQGIVYQNDYFVLPRIQSVEYDKDNPRVELRISPQSAISRTKGIKTAPAVVY